MDGNYSIYSWSQLESLNWMLLFQVNWFTQNVSMKVVSNYNISYYQGDSCEELFQSRTVLGVIIKDVSFDGSRSYFETKKDAQFSSMIHSNSHIYPVNVITLWLDKLKARNINLENITHRAVSISDLVGDLLLRSESAEIEAYR